MLARFSVQFVIAVFGGFAVGLLVGLLANALGQDWNIFAVGAWGILVGALALTFRHALGNGSGRDR